MAIPLNTVTCTVTRTPSDGVDGYSSTPPAPETVVTGLRAVISAPSASVQLSHGDRVVYTARLTCDPVELLPGDELTDNFGGTWEVLWARHSGTSLGLGHVIGSLRMVKGAS